MYISFLAWRYMLLRPVSYLAILAIMVAVGALIVVSSVMQGFLDESESLVRGTTADIVVYPWGMRDGGPLTRAAIEDVVARHPRVIDACGRLVRPGVFKSKSARGLSQATFTNSQHGTANQLLVLGLDPEDEAGVSGFTGYLEDIEDPERRVDDVAQPFKLDRSLIDGRYRMAPLPRVLVGIELMKHLDLRKGEILDIVTLPDEVLDAFAGGGEVSGEFVPASGTFVIAGAFKTGHYDFDIGHVFIEIERFRAWCGTSQAVSELYVAVEPVEEDEELDAIRDELGVALDQAGIGASVQTWRDRHHIMLAAVQNEKMILRGLLLLFLLLTCCLALCIVAMMVQDKIRDIGILSSIGAPPFGIACIFALCGGLLGLLGAAAGTAGGLAVATHANEISDWIERTTGHEIFAKNVYAFSEIPTTIVYSEIAMFAACAVLFSLGGCLIPAWWAGSFDPVRALRNE